MMIPSRREKLVPPQGKQEANSAVDGGKLGAVGVLAESSRAWTGLRDPRIVRVSRTLGGKDRHSKVSTIRGLRDRRVRLSVPTAVQLYDLQDRLGLSQPSKVVDWLLDASRHEIDRLPPLQIPPGCFLQCPPPSMAAAVAYAAPAATSTPSPPEDQEGVEEDHEHPSGSLSMAASLSMECGTRRRVSARSMVEKDVGFFRRIDQQEHQRAVADHEPHTIPAHGGHDHHLHGHRHASMPAGMLQGSTGEHNSPCSYHMEEHNHLLGTVPHLGCYPVPQGEEALHGAYRASSAATTVPSSMFSAYAAAAAAAAASAGYVDHRHPNSFPMGSPSAAQGFFLGYAPSASLHMSSSATANMRPLQLSISSMHHDSNSTEQLL